MSGVAKPRMPELIDETIIDEIADWLRALADYYKRTEPQATVSIHEYSEAARIVTGLAWEDDEEEAAEEDDDGYTPDPSEGVA